MAKRLQLIPGEHPSWPMPPDLREELRKARESLACLGLLANHWEREAAKAGEHPWRAHAIRNAIAGVLPEEIAPPTSADVERQP